MCGPRTTTLSGLSFFSPSDIEFMEHQQNDMEEEEEVRVELPPEQDDLGEEEADVGPAPPPRKKQRKVRD